MQRAELIANLPAELLQQPPRIDAASPEARAALGYLRANCGYCHKDPDDFGAGVPVDLQLALLAKVRRSAWP